MEIQKKAFFPEIETLRAIAVIMVLISHFIPNNSSYYIPYMWYGVQLFFTISGFLITNILLGNIHTSNTVKKSRVIKNFFIRRVLRLFPIYYLFVITFFTLRNVFSVYIWNNDYNWYFFTYLQNMYFFKVGSLHSSFSHLWSLGVEEQFYLVWPFLLIFVNKRYYSFIFLFLILTSISLIVIFRDVPAFGVLTCSNFHTLGIGALIAYLYYFKKDSQFFSWLIKYRFFSQIVCLIIFIYSLVVGFNIIPLNKAFVEIFLMFSCGFLVFNSIIGWPKNLNFFFKNKGLMQIGKISYGIYLYHWVIPPVLALVISKIPILSFLKQENVLLNFVMLTSYSFIIAFMSYYLIEIRFLRLKDKFKK